MATDKEHLQWIHNRIVEVYGESENVDFLIRMRQIIDKQDTELNLHSVMLSLPSDEEISHQAKQKYPYKKTKEGTYYEGKSKGYAEGAHWMKFQIEKLNKA